MSETTTNLDFPTALKYCLEGKKIRNLNWNGKGMYAFAMEGYPECISANKALSDATGIDEGSTVKILPYLMMCNAKGEFVPWLISQMDVFSTWEVIE